MFSKSIGRLAANASRRRDAAGVRVHPDAGQVPSPTKHRAPARNAAGALHQIKAEAPTMPKPLPDAFAFESFALGWMDDDISRMRLDAAAKEQRANQLLGEAVRLRTAADTWERLRRIADVFAADEPPAPVGQEAPQAVAGDLCFGCERSRDTLPCYSALEGRDVALCPRCHPSADDVDDSGADGEEPELDPFQQAEAEQDAAEAEAERALDAFLAAEPPHDEELPEALTSGPAAVPQLVVDGAKSAYSRYVIGDGDPDTVTLPAVLDDTLTDLEAVDGAR